MQQQANKFVFNSLKLCYAENNNEIVNSFSSDKAYKPKYGEACRI